MKTHTKGNVIVEDIKVGDIHYEYELNIGIKLEVVEKPELIDDVWTWKSVPYNNKSADPIIYAMAKNAPSYLAPNLYDYEAYKVSRMY